MKKSKPFVIGITGCSGSGKTFAIEELKKIFGETIVVISEDNYYKNTLRMGKERWERADLDTPDSFDNKMLIKDLKDLLAGKTVTLPIYDYKTSSRLKRELKISPSYIIIVEGLFIFNLAELRHLIDLKVFLDAEADFRLSRRLLRDIEERGDTVENLARSINWYLNIVKPQQEKYVLPMKKYADLVIKTNKGGIEAVEVLEEKIRKVLAA